MTAAILQIFGAICITIAAFVVAPTLGVFVLGMFCLAFGIWEEVA